MPQVTSIPLLLKGGQGQPSQNMGWGSFCGSDKAPLCRPQCVHGLEVGGVRLLPCLSLNLCKSHFSSGDKPQFSFKFSKALVTHTPKGVKESVLFARGLEPLLEACWPRQNAKRVVVLRNPFLLCHPASLGGLWALPALGAPDPTDGGGGVLPGREELRVPGRRRCLGRRPRP